jgi:NTP pyrophosphatase (non-canonical NTP hydrolase)
MEKYKNELGPEVATQLNDMVLRIGNFNIIQGWRNKSQEIVSTLIGAGREDLIPVFKNYLAAAMIALIHSELSEGLEGLRKNLMDDHLPHRKMVEAEMADVIIRVFDFADAFGLDLGGAVIEKDAYNHHREDHREEVRNAPGGKKF